MDRRGLGSVALQALGVLFAVLMALGVDEAWQARENRALGREAVERILDEIESNQAELLDVREDNLVLLADLADAAASEEDMDLSADYSVAILSAAAWEAAGLTSAVRFMDFEEVSRFSRLYKLQSMYEAQQGAVVQVLASVSSLAESSSSYAIGRLLLGPVRISDSLEEGLVIANDSVLTQAGRALSPP